MVCDTTMDAGNCEANEGSEDVEDTELIHFRIRDFGSSKVTRAFARPTTTIQEFLKNMSGALGIPHDQIELTYQDKATADIYTLSKLSGALTFAAINITPSRTVEYTLCVDRKKKKKPKVCLVDDEDLDLPDETVMEPRPQSSKSDTMSSKITSTINEYVGKEFVGLKNQKSTCYMNSLLQSLFFCPEFRNAIYLHEFQYDPKKKSLGAALQRLFLRLQFSNRSSIETDEITRTFGWKEYDSSVQHDIEELYRIIMDCLNDEFKKSGPNSITESLYGGVMADYVECLKCNKRNVKKNLFLAVHLPVRIFGKPLPKPTLEEALKAYIQPELLSEGNQYMCEACNCLVDAKKGLGFESLPYFMCLQLQRSEFDYETLTRKKCSDKVGFPFILDMNEFVMNKTDSANSNENMIAPVDINDIRGNKYKNLRISHSRPSITLLNNNEDDKSGTTGAAFDEKIQNSPNMYQLLGVLVHRGSSSLAGHYYAYILDLETSRWYVFNDTSVRRIPESDIAETYGDSYLNEDKDGIAYMLIYRKVDTTYNSLPLTTDELPQRISDLWKEMEAQEIESQTKETYEKSIFRTNVYARELDGWNSSNKSMVIQKSDTMAEASVKCFLDFYPGDSVEPNCIRLTRFNEQLGIMDMSFDGKENEPFGMSYKRPADLEQNEALMLEIRDADVPFDNYEPSDFIFKTHLIKATEDVIVKIKEVHAKPSDAIGQLKQKIGSLFHVPFDSLNVIAQINGTSKFLSGDDLSVDTYAFGKVNDLFVECIPDSETKNMLTFITNHYGCFLFNIECKKIELEQGITNVGLSNGVEDIKLSDENASTNSLTTFDVSAVHANTYSSSSPTESDNALVSKSSDTNPLHPQSSLEGNSPRYLYYRVVGEVPASQDGWKAYMVKADRQMTLRYLSRQIRFLTSVAESQFSLFKVANELEEEVLDYSMRLETLNFELLRVKMTPRLLKDEGRIRIYLLDLENASESSPLAEVVLNPTMTVKECKRAIETQLFDHQDLNQKLLAHYRLRRKSQSNPSRVMRDHQKIGEFFTKMEGDIFLQPLTAEDTYQDQCHCLLLKYWNPAELVLDPPIEITFKYDYTVSLEKLLEEEVSKVYQIEKANLEVAVPDTEYPHNLNPIAVHEILTWFKLDNTTKKHISIYNDEGVLFVRDSTKQLKKISPEMRRIFEDEAYCKPSDYTFAHPKRGGEIGLKINLARTPPT